MRWKITEGDCVALMAAMPESSVDAIVCDPPYGLEFMGKEWDRLTTDTNVGKARKRGFDKATGKPDQREQNEGGTWFGSRESTAPNYTRTTNAKCRKCGKWKISGGHGGDGNTLGCKCEHPDFPNLRAVAGVAMQEWHYLWLVEALRVAKPGAHLLAFGGTRTFHRMAVAIEDAGWEIRDTISWLYATGFPKSHNLDGDHAGWGTALKPAWEPIIVARKPLIGTVAANVQRYGTGAINVDACRIPTDDCWQASGKQSAPSTVLRGGVDGALNVSVSASHPQGRWPANVMLDEEAAAMLDEQSGQKASRWGGAVEGGSEGGIWSASTGKPADATYGDFGGASRFFYVAKPSAAERSAGLDANSHPTVKPITLMRYLCRLVTPPGGVVLDPFVGSGTTGCAAMLEGFDFLGMEREAEYVTIAKARIAHYAAKPKQGGLL